MSVRRSAETIVRVEHAHRVERPIGVQLTLHTLMELRITHGHIDALLAERVASIIDAAHSTRASSEDPVIAWTIDPFRIADVTGIQCDELARGIGILVAHRLLSAMLYREPSAGRVLWVVGEAKHAARVYQQGFRERAG